jgi:oligopeptide transport system ATP-binding protein
MIQESGDNLVAIRGLTREFTSHNGLFGSKRSMKAVNDVSLDVPRGKVTGVVGESGCGKSTLARLVLRLIDASSGTINFDGVDLGNLSSGDLRKLRRRMQMVFQDPYSAIDPRYTIRRALLEPFQVQGIRLDGKQASAGVEELIAMVGLSPRMAASYPHQLSGGQKQRVGVARALALKPSFLVLDEPTASLDVSIQAQIIDLLDTLRNDLGLTYLFISHDLSLVRYFCDRVVVMYLGRVVEILPSAQTKPRHHYSRALMDSNFEPDPKRRKAVTRLDGEIPSPFDDLPGCAFAVRCPAATELCQRERPVLSATDEGHQVACHHPIE